jgi:hypothetical protein
MKVSHGCFGTKTVHFKTQNWLNAGKIYMQQVIREVLTLVYLRQVSRSTLDFPVGGK